MEEIIEKGTIQEFRGSWMSGLATLVIEDELGGIHHVPCDNAPTVRALEGAFGGVIGDAHDVKTDGGHVSKEVYYSTDFVGVLIAFTPVDEASDELIEYYEKQEV